MSNLQEKAEQALENENLNQALDACLLFEGHTPDKWVFDICVKVAQTYRQQKNFEGAFAVYNEISRRWPSVELPINCLMDKAHTLREGGEIQQAVCLYYSVVLKQNANGWACLWYARCLIELQQRRKASLVLESYLQNYSPNAQLRFEFALTLLEISTFERNAELINERFAACLPLINESRQYQQNKFILLTSRIHDAQIACEYLYKLLLAFSGNEQNIKSIATHFYHLDKPNTCIEALLMLNHTGGKLDNQSNHIINLLVACVCEVHPVNRGYLWHKAYALLDNYYEQQKPAYGYWSYFHDCFGDKSATAIQSGQNINTGIESILKNFALTYWSHRHKGFSHSEVSGRKPSILPPRIVLFSNGQANKAQSETSLNIAPEFNVEHYSTLSAASFVTQHYTNRVYKAWRLCRSEADKEALFKLCYLVKFGGAVLSNNTKITKSLIQIMLEPPSSLVLGKGYMGISSKVVFAMPNHPLLVAILNYAIQNLLNRSRLPSLYTTGSLCWAKMYYEYASVMQKRGTPLDVQVLSAREVEALSI